jgi:hypothetical protein
LICLGLAASLLAVALPSAPSQAAPVQLSGQADTAPSATEQLTPPAGAVGFGFG